MKFTATYTLEDYIEAQKLHLRSSKNGWVIRWFFPAIGVGTLASLAALAVAHIPLNAFQIFYFGFLGIFFVSLPIFTVQVSTRYLFKKSKFLHYPFEFEIMAEEVKMNSELNSGTIKWPLFIKSAYNDRMVILMSTPRTMLMIPKRVIPAEADWNQLLEWVKEKVKNN